MPAAVHPGAPARFATIGREGIDAFLTKATSIDYRVKFSRFYATIASGGFVFPGIIVIWHLAKDGDVPLTLFASLNQAKGADRPLVGNHKNGRQQECRT
jgi:hypothetical protein